MRRLLFLFSFCCLTMGLHAANKASRDLASLLEAMIEQQSIHPDSIVPGIQQLEARKDACTDPTERAITQAVLGYLYTQRAYTATSREHLSDIDSTDMRSWSTDEFLAVAGKRFDEALSDLDLLHAAKISDWAPLLDRGDNDSYYNNDMLMVVWRATQDVGSLYTKNIPSRANLINYYKSQHNREATLLLALDTVNISRHSKLALLQLKEEYKDLPLCGGVYLRLSDTEVNDSTRVHWLREGIRRYPKYVCRSQLEERLQAILSPACSWSMHTHVPYPGRKYSCDLHMKNVKDVSFSLYRLKESFDEDTYNRKGDKALKYLQQNATLVSSERHTPTPHKEWESFVDTLDWVAPDYGYYALVMQTSTSMKLNEPVSPEVMFLHVSKFTVSSISLPGEKVRVVVNDAMSGEPLEGVNLHVVPTGSLSSDAIELVTDREGKAEFALLKDTRKRFVRSYSLTASRGEDKYGEEHTLYASTFSYDKAADKDETTNLYTDRSIYRPGQTVHVGGLVSLRKQWDEEVVKDKKITLKLYNPNGKEVSAVDVTTDSMGVFSADFVLPTSGLTGRFRITAVNARANLSIRVEEYKRPMFEVSVDEAPALQMPADSITLTGKAINYNGAPVRNARVVGKYRWNEAYWWWARTSESRHDAKTDTVQTDDEGRFSVTIPIKQSAYSLRRGRVLTVNYDVVSPTGETHTAEQSVFLCSKPISIYANIPNMVDKDKLSPWTVTLSSSTGKEVEGEVKLAFKQKKETVFETTTKAGSRIMPDFVKDIPSGRYDIMLTTNCSGDTDTTTVSDVALFSQHDTRLPMDSTLWFYAPELEFGPDKAARIQIGSSKDVYIYYTLTSNKELVDDRLIHLNDSVFCIDIPYEERFEQGLRVSLLLVKDQQTRMEDAWIHLVAPNKQLKPKWTTFRDKLQPGQKETWQLQLQRPDATPAKVNLMASLYDASLDALCGHSWNIHHQISYHISDSRLRTLTPEYWRSMYASFILKPIDVKSLSFASFKSELFALGHYGYVRGFGGGKTSRLRGNSRVRTESMVLYETSAMDAAPMMAKAMMVSDGVNEEAISYGGIVGTGESNDAALENEASDEGDPVVTLRENFDETAFFYPSLRSNEQGEVTLSFTLPESLTTWRLLGLAHTEDMLTTLLDEKVVAQKDLMAQLALPRFLRQGDKASLAASIFNISEGMQKGRGVLTILDASTEKVLAKRKVDFAVDSKRDSTFLVPFEVPEDAGMLIVRWVAEGSTCSDGEQRYLPVLSNKEWVTDARALTYTKAGTYTEDLSKLFPVKSATNRQLTIEYVSQPVWYAIQALPSLVWPKDEDVLSLATAYYAGCISGDISSKNPMINNAIEAWQREGKMNKSKLLQNEDLKNILLNETPWIAEAEQETERIQRLGTLFDEATQSSLQKTYLDKLRNLQNSDGSFSWYPGMKGSYYMTREVAYLLTRLKVLTNKVPQSMLDNAISYIRKDRPTYLGTSSLRYLYVLYQSGTKLDKQDKHNADSLIKVLVKHPEDLGLEERALAAIVLDKAGKKKDASRYLETVKKFLVTNDEGLTYFEFPQGSFRSINRKQHIHVQVLEALQMLSPSDSVLIDGMRRYLLRSKRTSEWDSPVNSANAVYALLLDNGDVLQEGSDAEITLKQKKGTTKLQEEESSFGFIRERMAVESVPQSLKIVKEGNHESWGGIYAQYLAPVSDVESSTGELRVRQQWNTTSAKVGDRLHVRYTITAERDCEYVVLHAPRSAATEPVSQLSGYRWQGGLGYYRAVKDAATEFFFDYLPRGTYEIEEDVLVEHPGEYSTGITTIQCLYAPEYNAHTSDARMKIK